jgi:CrcB protein
MSLLGGVGALARFAVDGVVAERVPGEFPFGTLAVNASGAVLLGVVVGLTLGGDAQLVVATGTLGSYTTFSTWMFETHRLGADNRLGLILLNIAVSLGVGIVAVSLGRAIATGL